MYPPDTVRIGQHNGRTEQAGLFLLPGNGHFTIAVQAVYAGIKGMVDDVVVGNDSGNAGSCNAFYRSFTVLMMVTMSDLDACDVGNGVVSAARVTADVLAEFPCAHTRSFLYGRNGGCCLMAGKG